MVRVHHVSAPALVLGSRQSPAEFAATPTRGAELVTRRSGGGAVWLAPGEQLWVDVVVPVGDPLHSDDIRIAAHRMGDAWSGALGSHTSTWRSEVTDPAASAIACFAGVGPGDVTLHGRKLVGISQRRTRHWSRFQCVAYRRWAPGEMLRILGISGRSEVARALRYSVAVLGDLGAPEARCDGSRAWTHPFVDRLVANLDLAPGT
jgi:lipoate-protein ligase A